MHNLSDLKLINFPFFGGDGASLSVYEGLNNVPFSIARIFTVSATEKCTRGFHAHKECTQLLVVLSGECTILCNDGAGRKEMTLRSDSQGLLIPPTIWAEQNYQASTILMVLADRVYDESDYIRDYNDFMEFRNLK